MIEPYFSPDVRPAVMEQGVVNLQSFRYSRKILKVAEQQALFGKEPEDESQRKTRD